MACEVHRFKLIGLNGHVVRANRKEDLGQAAMDHFFSSFVMKGETIIEMERQGQDNEFVDSQAFVTITPASDFVGTVEVHVEMTNCAHIIRDLGNQVLIWIVAMLSSFMFVCSFFV